MSITLGLVIVTALASYQAFSNRSMFDSLKHHPYTEKREKQYYRWLSSGFLHGSMNHLLINGFVLWMFGEFIERMFTRLFGAMGPVMFVLLYLTAIIAGNVPSFLKHKDNPSYSAIGASGATSALVLIYCLLNPWGWFIYPPVPAIVFAVGYLVYSSWADRSNKADGIGHSAHLYGALWGILFFVVSAPQMIGQFTARLMEGPSMPSFFG
jgi:membrane associated rhomboid family serine protease